MTANPHPIARQFLPRVNAILFIVLFLSTLSLGPRMLNIDGDLPRHFLMGKVVLESGVAPTQEIFSYPYEHRYYVPHEWLAGVMYYIVFLVLGLNGVVLLAAILIAATFGSIYSELLRIGTGKALPFLLIILGAIVTSIHWVARPHLFTMLYLAIWTILVNRVAHEETVRIWIFPAIMLVWANTHAEFIAGFLVLLAYSGGWFWQYVFAKSKPSITIGKNFGAITILSLIVSVINPAGVRVWDTVVGYLSNQYLMSRITETRPPDFARAEYWPLLLLLVISVLVAILKRGKLDLSQFFLLVGFGVMNLISARNAHLFGVVAPLVLCLAIQKTCIVWPLKMIEDRVAIMESQIAGYAWPIAATILFSVLMLTVPLRGFNRFEPVVFPVEAVRWLENHPQSGRMFNTFDWGGYLLFYLWPEQKVFIESQTDTQGELTQKYEIVITTSKGWQEIFKVYNIAWAIIPPGWDLTQELKAQGWETVYQDQTAIILVKR